MQTIIDILVCSKPRLYIVYYMQDYFALLFSSPGIKTGDFCMHAWCVCVYVCMACVYVCMVCVYVCMACVYACMVCMVCVYACAAGTMHVVLVSQ